MMKQNRWGVLLLLIAIIGWFVVITPQINSYSGYDLQAKVLSSEVSSYNQRIADLNTIQGEGTAVTSTLKALYLAMPSAPNVPDVLTMVEGIASTSGVTFTSAAVGTPDGSTVPVTVSFTGNQDTLNSFLTAVHNNIRTAIVQNQSITSDTNGNLSVTMQLGFVYQGGTNANQ